MRAVLARVLSLLAVALVAAQPAGAQVVEYYHLDALGSVRAVSNQAGQLVERHDYLPYGEECTAPPCAGVAGENTKKFTGKERDAETGLDYFGARYYGSKIGRFTSVDPYLDVSVALRDPQRWNRYSYVSNNPLSRIDPDGRDERQLIGEVGELIAEWQLRKAGYEVVLSATRKAVNQRGIDIIARKGAEVLVIDNKAIWGRATASSASALTENLPWNLNAAIDEIAAMLTSDALGAAEREAAEFTLKALKTGTFELKIMGAGGRILRVGARLTAAGVGMKWLGRGLGPALFIGTELYFVDDVGDVRADIKMTEEQEAVYEKYYKPEN